MKIAFLAFCFAKKKDISWTFCQDFFKLKKIEFSDLKILLINRAKKLDFFVLAERLAIICELYGSSLRVNSTRLILSGMEAKQTVI